ncbi:MAG: exopolysaccharide biosynthesis polyprenyl glycosylphosphotransferase [Flavobacteriaceae bacterium]
MRLTRFNTFFPLLFITSEFIIIYLVTKLMHYLTFAEWSIYNNLIISFWILLSIYNKAYNIGRGVSYLITIKSAFKSVFVLFSTISIVSLFLNLYEFTMTSIGLALLVFTISITIDRLLIHAILDKYRAYGGNIKNVAIIGSDKKGIEFYKTIAQNLHLGIRSKGIYGESLKSNISIPYLGSINDFYNNSKNINEVYISDDLSVKLKKELIEFSDLNLIKVRILPELMNYEFKNFFISKLINIPIIEVNQLPLDLWYNKIIKRSFDVLISSIVILFVLSWLIPLIGIIIKLQSQGPVLFTQSRHGIGGSTFRCYKFRSMIVNNNSDRVFADNNDKRLTKFGKFLRISALDEVPQFINVFLGDMSIIGPRPHPILLNNQYSEKIQKFDKRHEFKPGITGLAQINGFRGKINNYHDMSSRVKLDRYYFKNWSLYLDSKIFFQTALKLIRFNLS